MISDIKPQRHFIECGCKDPDHLLCFDFYIPFEEDGETDFDVSVSFTSKYYYSFWRRIKCALKYIFKRNKYLHTSDSLVVNKINIEAFKMAINEIEVLAKENKLW